MIIRSGSETMINYTIRYDVAGALIAVAVMLSYFRQTKIKTKVSDSFTALMWQCLCACCLDIASVQLIKYISPSNLWLNYIVLIAFYIFFNAMPLMFYLCSWFLSEKNRKMPLKQYWILFGLYLFFSLFTISSPLTHFVFWFDENLTFHHGKLFYVYYLLDIFYVGGGVLHFLRHRKHFTPNQIISLMFFTIVCFVASVVQTLVPYLLITCFAFSLTILITFLSLENPDDYIDSESGVYNRYAFMVRVQDNIDFNKPMFIIGLYSESLVHILRSIGEENRKLFYNIVFSFLKEKCGKENIYRLTYEKFAILLTGVSEEDCNALVKEIWNYFKEPIQCGNIEISIALNIRTTVYPDDVSTIEDLLDLIEDSLEEKTSYEEGVSLRANPNILNNRRREHKIVQILEDAMNNNSFDIVYQPIYNIDKGGYTSAEALLRLRTEELGDLTPDEFIPLAEKNGLALQIGNFVFKEVCKFIADNRLWEKGIENIHVNLSVIQCLQEKLYELLFDIMDQYKLDYKYVDLDVSETTTILANETLLRNMNVMINKGMSFSLDNYGTGLSNTNTLVKYPFSYVKLDKTLVRAAVNDDKARIILHKTVSMVKDLNMRVVAEGVEDMGEYDMVVYLGCNYIQGFMFSNPLSAEDYLKFVSRT